VAHAEVHQADWAVHLKVVRVVEGLQLARQAVVRVARRQGPPVEALEADEEKDLAHKDVLRVRFPCRGGL
jgi:hypothetical protein